MIRLFELRTEQGLSQRQLAKILNVSQGTYNNWENGKTQPSIEDLIKISGIFGVSVDYLICNQVEEVVVREDKDVLRKVYRLLQKLDDESLQAIATIIEKIVE